MRRSDHDVSDSIRTTDPIAVRDEVARIYLELYGDRSAQTLRRVFSDVARFYDGRHPDYYPCDTGYHDIQHVLDVTLALARLMDGYERSRRNGTPALPAEMFVLGIIAALFHDFGYLRRRNDFKHRYGAEYTLSHVSRGARFVRDYLGHMGMGRLGKIAGALLHFTGYERAAESIRIGDPLLRRVGQMLGTADIIAQMSDRCYLEKCRDRLYPEFVLGGLAQRRLPDGSVKTLFRSGSDLVRRTPGFYKTATQRLDVTLGRAHRYAEYHFEGQNIYLDEIDKSIRHAETLAEESADGALRRCPPWTLLPGIAPHPEGLALQ
jgi:hypothetical protein